MQRQFHVHECGAVNGGMSATSKAPSPPTQVAAAAGAVAIATAGGPPKRRLLRGSVGVRHAAGSRDTAFVEGLALGTLASSGGGVDVVLNSLTSPGEGRQFLLL